MENLNQKQHYERARKKVRNIKIFYVHLAGYIVLVALILYNFYIIEEGSYTSSIIALNLSVLVGWTVFIVLHAWRVFKEKKFFKKEWEDKKIKEFLGDEEEEITMWK